ncbi:aminotransferase class I/II-fold pyridoxal phosphate-dependent enzyme [Halobacterium litoreum]|uniref:Aminotransferase class I/II-fold pyridoxal phosphate-dependent enzyme n=1 Tax=Halobacterium litoreum TaxID=2039234 RepID=A0ABD5NDT4_9EURY|nr:aminotransferase class I/II-fold pyridoxal phosphate-dependent enzyme [Halobacterium litoreum]UHH13908.1 aminotransferase class I/II-fold pyridoxal phosphate-dependent enzyme [Halobacterium litoreum]
MDIDAFELERWFAEYEHDADVMLAESGVRSLPASRFDTDPGDLDYVIPTAGAPDVRETIAEEYDRTADEVVCTVGTQEANFLAFQSLLAPGDHAVVVTPTYQSLHAIPESICDVTRVPLEPPEWTLDTDAVADAIRPETELVVVNNPNNPTGRQHDEATVRELYDIAAEADAYLLCDEVYRELSPDPVPPVASMGEYGISTASLTKAYGLAGLRFGWLAGPREVVEGAEVWKDYTTISPTKFGQHVARQVLDDPEGLRREALAHVRANAEITSEWADDHGLGWSDPVGCNVFLDVPEGFDGSREFCRTVVEDASVVLAPGDCFGDAYDDYFRLGFGLPTDELRDGLARVADVL